MDRLSRILRPLLLGGAAAPAHILEEERYLPGDAGLIVADRYDAAVVRAGGASAARARAAQGRAAALRAPRRAPACRRRSTRRSAKLVSAAEAFFGFLSSISLLDVARARVAVGIVARRIAGDGIGAVGVGAMVEQQLARCAARAAGPR